MDRLEKVEPAMSYHELLLSGKKGVAEVLLEINQEHSKKFIKAKLARLQHRKKHPTEIVWLKCMDGRLNGPVFTNTPLGLITPFRSAGARFDLGSMYFMDKVREVIDFAVDNGNNSLFFCTYHFSKGSNDRGCKAFNFDTEAARESAFKLKRQFDEAFDGSGVAFSMVVGLETDEQALVLHTSDGKKVFRLAEAEDGNADALKVRVKEMYPEFPANVIDDLIPLLQGNIDHIAEVRTQGQKPEELDHREVGLFLGRGFPWFHTPNRAIIIGPWENWKHELIVGGQIILSNIEKKRIPQGIRPVFMVSAPYREKGSTEYRLAPAKAKFLAREGRKILEENVPDLLQHLDVLTGTVNMDDLLFEELQ
jgi:hypothetical protein